MHTKTIRESVWQCEECGQVSRDALTFPSCNHKGGLRIRKLEDPIPDVNPLDLYRTERV